jgi:CarboxypepD_reg-like domain/TonB-dependent Receptor Plug Domain
MKFVTTLIICFFWLFSTAQNITVSGYITDENGEALTGATVFEPQTNKGIVANTYGFYSFSLLKNKETTLQYSFVGFEKQIFTFFPVNDTVLNISLKSQTLKEVEIREQRDKPIENVSTIALPMEQIKKIPSIGGEVDIIKALGLTPGVSNGTEGSAGLYVRGGTPDQNLILLDEAVVYNPNHLFGFISVFNPDAVKNVTLIKGGFPARYGGRLSSVLDVTLREGSMKKRKTDIGIGLLSSRLMIERPLLKDKMSLIVSARSSYLGVLAFPLWLNYVLSSKNASYINYFMYDANIKLNYKIDDKNKLYLSLYHGNDFFRSFDRISGYSEDKTKLNWGNTTATLRYTKELSPRVFWKNMLLYTRFNYKTTLLNRLIDENKRYEVNSFSGLQDYTLRSAIDIIPNTQHYIRAGIELTRHQFTPQYNNNFSNDTTIKNRSQRDRLGAIEPVIFIEDEWKIFKNLKILTGLRLNLFVLPSKTYHSVEPRATLLWTIIDDWALKGAYSKMQQNVHLLTNNGVGFQNDIWVPSTDKIAPQKSEQYALGLSKYFPKSDVEMTVEVYHKISKNLIDYKEGANIIVNLENWQAAIERNGIGKSQGLEVFIHKKTGRFNGFMSYTLAKTERQFDKINNGQIYPFRYDARHNFAITSNYQLSKKWDISATFALKSGEPITFPSASIDHNPFDKGYLLTPDLAVYNTRNGFRLPAYHRADIGLNKTTTTKKGRRKTWSFGAYNLYNRQNILYIEIVSKRIYVSPNVFTYKQVLKPQSLFGIIPSASYALSF